MNDARQRLDAVRARIAAAAERTGRKSEDILLLAVSKKQSAAAVGELARAGGRNFGENYVQEARDKQRELQSKELPTSGAGTATHSGSTLAPLVWHLIGPLQSNKAKLAAELFDWVHTVDRSSLAQKLSQAAHLQAKTLKVLVQVNTSGEGTKSGVDPDGVEALCAEVTDLPNLELRGLMCVPEPQEDSEASRGEFRMLNGLLHQVRDKLGLASMTELSMGMSADLEVAIEEGSTIVRVGTALFGPRPA